MIKSTCDSQIYTAIKGASITNQELFLINTSSDKLTYAYKGHVTAGSPKPTRPSTVTSPARQTMTCRRVLIETHFE